MNAKAHFVETEKSERKRKEKQVQVQVCMYIDFFPAVTLYLHGTDFHISYPANHHFDSWWEIDN